MFCWPPPPRHLLVAQSRPVAARVEENSRTGRDRGGVPLLPHRDGDRPEPEKLRRAGAAGAVDSALSMSRPCWTRTLLRKKVLTLRLLPPLARTKRDSTARPWAFRLSALRTIRTSPCTPDSWATLAGSLSLGQSAAPPFPPAAPASARCHHQHLLQFAGRSAGHHLHRQALLPGELPELSELARCSRPPLRSVRFWSIDSGEMLKVFTDSSSATNLLHICNAPESSFHEASARSGFPSLQPAGSDERFLLGEIKGEWVSDEWV